MNNRIAVLILTYNEETHIADCIKSAAFADEIIVIDSGSTDQTESIVHKMGAKFIYHSFEEGFSAQRNFALTQTDADWVFYLDADERLTPEATAEIRHIVENGPIAAYRILRMNVIFGQPIKHGGHAPDLSMRLYPRSSIHWEGKVHEHATTNAPIHVMKSTMIHYTYTSWSRYFFKLDQYTTILAEQMHKKGKKMKLTDILIRPWFAFFKFYILKSGWRDGMTGLIFALLHAFYTMTKYIKLHYLEKEGFSR